MRFANVIMATVAAATLVGCGETKLLSRTLPDETQVIDGPSLAVPPNMELRPPREGGDYETTLRAQKTVEAQGIITGVSATSVPATASPEAEVSEAVPGSDSWLLEQAGTQADPNVRAELERAAADPNAEEKKKGGLLSRWFGKDDE